MTTCPATPSSRTPAARALLILLLTVVLAVSACGGPGGTTETPAPGVVSRTPVSVAPAVEVDASGAPVVAVPDGTVPPAPTEAAPAETAPSETVPPAPVEVVTHVARSADPVTVYAAATGDQVVAELAGATGFGSTRALRIRDVDGTRFLVDLPVRPNGAQGWIDATVVEVREVETRIVVDLTARELTLWSGDDEVLRSPVAVGVEEHPTPEGEYFLTDLIRSEEPGGPYGPFALGLSAYSETLTDFAGGDGQVAIHGTNDPGSIGMAASHGCVRVPNEVVAELVTHVELGTPVQLIRS